jgi:hypothetical protein
METPGFFKLAFSDSGQPSSSRLLTAVTVLSSAIGFLAVIFKTWHMPDGTALAGLGAFAASPYAVNRASKMFGKDKDTDQSGS